MTRTEIKIFQKQKVINRLMGKSITAICYKFKKGYRILILLNNDKKGYEINKHFGSKQGVLEECKKLNVEQIIFKGSKGTVISKHKEK